METTPEQAVVDQVATNIKRGEVATYKEARVLVIARFAYRAGKRIDPEGIPSDIPALIEQELPRSSETQSDIDENQPCKIHKKWFDFAMKEAVRKQQVFWAFNEGQNG